MTLPDNLRDMLAEVPDFLGSARLLEMLRQNLSAHAYWSETPPVGGPYLACACGWRSDDNGGLAKDAAAALWVHLSNEMHAVAVETLREVGVVRRSDAAPTVARLIADARAEAWEEAAELADSVIVSWQGVSGLHPEAPEPHPAALRAAGARRTLVVLRSRVAEAFAGRTEGGGDRG
jgi:hypothetical protein